MSTCVEIFLLGLCGPSKLSALRKRVLGEPVEGYVRPISVRHNDKHFGMSFLQTTVSHLMIRCDYFQLVCLLQ